MSNFDFIIKNDLTVGENVIVNGNYVSIDTIKTYVGSNIAIDTNQIAVDTFSKLVTRSATYLMQIVSDTSYQISEISLVHNGIDSKLTEYAVLTTGITPLATFATDIVGNEVRVLGAMNSGTGNIWFQRTGVDSIPPG